MDPARLGPDHDPSKKGEHLEDPMMVTMDAKARAAQEAELKAMFAGARSARSEATEATPEAKDEGAAEAKGDGGVFSEEEGGGGTSAAPQRNSSGAVASPSALCSRAAPATPTASLREGRRRDRDRLRHVVRLVHSC